MWQVVKSFRNRGGFSEFLNLDGWSTTTEWGIDCIDIMVLREANGQYLECCIRITVELDLK